MEAAPLPLRSPLAPSPRFGRSPASDLSLRIAESTYAKDPTRPKSSHISGVGLGALSPVTPAGAYEFDRVLKSDRVLKRKKRTNIQTWKPVYLVLRPYVLSVYKDQEETHLRHQISLVDITAVALRTGKKRRGDHDGCFDLYTPARNYHFEAASLLEAEQWVSIIRRESHLHDEDMNMILSSPEDTGGGWRGFGRTFRPPRAAARSRDGSSSPDSIDRPPNRGIPRPRIPAMRSSSTVQELSGPEGAASHSDFSDTPYAAKADPISISSTARNGADVAANAMAPSSTSSSQTRMMYLASRSPGGMSRLARDELPEAFDEADRIVQQGYVMIARSRGGVRQWKRCWAVLRSKNLSLYKTEEEYSALLILPISSVVDAGDIDPVSKKKRYCMQIISEERAYRFAVASEEELSRWVGSLKSVLARRRDHNATTAATTTTKTTRAMGK